MTPNTLDEQLTKYLTDVHAIELQALAQLEHVPPAAGEEEISSAFSAHLTETEGQERLVAERLSARGAAPEVAHHCVEHRLIGERRQLGGDVAIVLVHLVHHGRQIKPTFASGNKGNIRDPNFIPAHG